MKKAKAPDTEVTGTANVPEYDLLQALSAGEMIDHRNADLLTWLREWASFRVHQFARSPAISQLLAEDVVRVFFWSGANRW